MELTTPTAVRRWLDTNKIPTTIADLVKHGKKGEDAIAKGEKTRAQTLIGLVTVCQDAKEFDAAIAAIFNGKPPAGNSLVSAGKAVAKMIGTPFADAVVMAGLANNYQTMRYIANVFDSETITEGTTKTRIADHFDADALANAALVLVERATRDRKSITEAAKTVNLIPYCEDPALTLPPLDEENAAKEAAKEEAERKAEQEAAAANVAILQQEKQQEAARMEALAQQAGMEAAPEEQQPEEQQPEEQQQQPTPCPPQQSNTTTLHVISHATPADAVPAILDAFGIDCSPKTRDLFTDFMQTLAGERASRVDKALKAAAAAVKEAFNR